MTHTLAIMGLTILLLAGLSQVIAGWFGWYYPWPRLIGGLLVSGLSLWGLFG